MEELFFCASSRFFHWNRFWCFFCLFLMIIVFYLCSFGVIAFLLFPCATSLVSPPQYLIRPFSPGCHLVQVSPLCSSAPAHMYSALTPCQCSIVHDTCFTLMVSMQHHMVFFNYCASDAMPTSCFSLLIYVLPLRWLKIILKQMIMIR